MTRQEEEELLYQNEFFILRTARITTGRPITKSDDECGSFSIFVFHALGVVPALKRKRAG